jgi:hypothetical protein
MVPFAGEPLRATQLEVGLNEVGPELQRLPEEGLRVLEHLPLEVDKSQVEVRVQRGLAIVVQADGLGQVLDRLAEDPLLEANVAHVDPGERVGRLLHEDAREGAQRVVVVLVQHLRPAKQRLRLGVARCEPSARCRAWIAPAWSPSEIRLSPSRCRSRPRGDPPAPGCTGELRACAESAVEATCLYWFTSVRISSLSRVRSVSAPSTRLKNEMISRFGCRGRLQW